MIFYSSSSCKVDILIKFIARIKGTLNEDGIYGTFISYNNDEFLNFQHSFFFMLPT